MRKASYVFLYLSLIVFIPFTSLAQKKYLTDEQMLKNNLKRIIVSLPQMVSWENENELILKKSFYPDTVLKTIVIDPTTGKETILEKYAPPADKKKKVYSKEEDLYFSIGDSNEVKLTNDKAIEKNPTFSPDTGFVAYTKNNNLYAFDLKTKKEIQLTMDGNDSIMNGYCSWVYNEEILGHDLNFRSFWWSPDSRNIVFFRTDDSPVPIFTISDAKGQHGWVQRQRYPKAGDKNPEIKIGIVTSQIKKLHGLILMKKTTSILDCLTGGLIEAFCWYNG